MRAVPTHRKIFLPLREFTKDLREEGQQHILSPKLLVPWVPSKYCLPGVPYTTPKDEVEDLIFENAFQGVP